MKKRLLSILAIFLLCLPFASASFFDLITGKTAETESIPLVKEQIKCVFTNSDSLQKCYTSDGRFSCAGVGSCAADVYGDQGAKLEWKSSCSGDPYYTLVDGNNEDAAFKCEQTQIPASAAPATSDSTIKEQVKCIFVNSNSEQKCYTSDGRFSCAGAGSCAIDVSGQQGQQLHWKNSCGSEAYTKIDGVDDSLEFKCEPIAIPQPTPSPVLIAAPAPIPSTSEYIKEQIKSIMDGNNENAEFNCGAGSASTCRRDKAKLHYFYWENECPLCESEKFFLEKLKLKYPQVEYDFYIIDGHDRGSYSYFVVSNLKQGMPTIFLDDRIWTGYDDNIAAEIENKVKSCLEKGCSLTPAVPAAAIQPAPTSAAIPISTVPSPSIAKEQVECIFWNSNALQNPHTAMPEKCYTDNGRFGCAWTGEVVEKESNGGKIRYANCIAEVSDASGTQLIWKSSCGGYAYTTIDGNNEAAEFKCVPSSEVKEEQISGKGFKRAYWQCYDGAEQKTAAEENVNCKSSEEWQERAKEFCKEHCYADKSKCGVNSFSLMDECYIEAEKEGVIFAIPEKRGGKKFAMPPDSKTGDIMAVYFYSDSCRYCLGMNEEVDKVSKELNMGIKRVNAVNDPELVESYGIKGVPAFLVLRYESDGIKEFIRYGKADSTAIINWIAMPEIPEIELEKPKPQEIEEVKEEIMICKDSCPLDGKCYPFGYRKGEKYCSDEGAFKDQLKADETCENNFECSTNICIDGKCVSSGIIQKFMGWFKKLFGGVDKEEAKEEIAKSIDCGASTECIENAFKECKPAKMSHGQGGPISEIAIVGLEGRKCVLKMTGSTEMTGGAESMICKFENYALGMKNIGSGPIEQYCTGKLTHWLAAAPKMMKIGEAPALNSAVAATKLSADPNDLRYSFAVHDPDGIGEFNIIKSDFGEVAVKAEPPCAKDFTSVLKFNPSDLPFRASVDDCGTPVTRTELKVETKIPAGEK